MCVYTRRKAGFLGRAIYEADKIRETPLARLTQDSRWLSPDGTAKNLLITAPWKSLLPHLRLAFGMRWHQGELRSTPFTFKIITDEQIRVGTFADKGDGVESVAQLLNADVDLVVLRLGFLALGNKAMPEILRSAIMHRVEMSQRPLWLIEDPKEPFTRGHLSWSDKVGEYVATAFQRMVLP